MIIKEIHIIDPAKDPRVKIDKEHAALIPSAQRCTRCSGTGNELYFMYRRCRACDGDGFSRGNEQAIAETDDD